LEEIHYPDYMQEFLKSYAQSCKKPSLLSISFLSFYVPQLDDAWRISKLNMTTTKPTTSASTGALLCLLAVVPTVLAFAPSSGSTGRSPHRQHIVNIYPSRPAASTAKTTAPCSTCTATSTTALGYATSPLPSTNDPYVLLGLSTQEGSRLGSGASGTAAFDEKEVKRAFRRMTKLYHPDAVTTKNSTESERRQANDDFARINAAYQAIVNPEAVEAPKVRFLFAFFLGLHFDMF